MPRQRYRHGWRRRHLGTRGCFSYFAEMAAAEGMVTMIASNATPWVAPHGATEGRFGNQPDLFRVSQHGRPHHLGYRYVVHHACRSRAGKKDGTESGGRHRLRCRRSADDGARRRTGRSVYPVGRSQGDRGWGHVVQLLGVLAGSPIQPPELAEFGFVIIAMRPDLMMPEQEYREKVTALCRSRA